MYTEEKRDSYSQGDPEEEDKSEGLAPQSRHCECECAV